MNDLFFADLELIKKDDSQYKAYQSMGNTVVIAGPGSGKTRVLTLKAVSLAASQIEKPCGLACISFSRESVRELKKRLKGYGFIPSNRDFIGTVHSFSLLHVIQPFARLYPEYGISYPIKILPYEVSDEIYNNVLNELHIEEPKDLPLIDINKHRSLALLGQSTVQITSNEMIKKAAKLYEDKVRQTIYIDFIDIINFSARIIREKDYVSRSLQARFPWLLVDEYQDLGKALHEMVLELVFNADMKLYAVGDVNQSIYGFNGGYPDFLEELTEYPEITTVKLSANYRSSQHIIEASLAALQPVPPVPDYVAQKRSDGADFTFITCDEDMDQQYDVVAKKVIPVLTGKNVPLNEIAIIVNSNKQIREMSDYLSKAAIPFFIVNWNFENSAVLVWLQECAAWCIDRKQQSFDELFNFWIRLLESHSDPRKDWEKIRQKTFFSIILKDSAIINTVYEWLQLVLDRLNLDQTLKESEIYPNEVENIQKLLTEAKLHNLKNSKLTRFANLGFPENEVTITTRHSCKGLEFEAVILLGMEEDHFPSFYHLNNLVALAEDQRICYVCISRAKKACVLIRSSCFNIPTKKGNWHKNFAASRYWVALEEKFGTDENRFNHKDFN